MIIGALVDVKTGVPAGVNICVTSDIGVDALTEVNANVLTAIITVEIARPAFSCWPIVVLGYTHALQA